MGLDSSDILIMKFLLIQCNCKEKEEFLMKKQIKNFMKAVFISISSLTAGMAITAVSFNLFDSLTNNQMKLLFALDVICLAILGTIIYFIVESKKIQNRRKKEFEKRHNKRIAQRNDQMKDIFKIINHSDFAA